MKVQCAACGVEGLMVNSRDKEWTNIGGQWFCQKQACQQLAQMPLARHRLPRRA